MCVCGCKKYMDQGEEALVNRVKELAQELNINADNLKLYESAESICSLLGTKTSLFPQGRDVWEVVQFVNQCHESLRPARQQAAVKAAREVFSKLPVEGNTKDILRLYQQLEQLHHTMKDEMINNLKDPALIALLQKMKNYRQIHKECESELAQLYNL